MEEVKDHYAAINNGSFKFDPGEDQRINILLHSASWDVSESDQLAEINFPRKIWKLKRDKAARSDVWVTEFLKLMKDVIKSPTEQLLRVTLRAGETPDSFDYEIKKPFTKPGKAGKPKGTQTSNFVE